MEQLENSATKCEHCGHIPDFVKHTFGKEVYYNFRCVCKETPLRRSYATAENEWETKFSKTLPSDMPKIKTEKGDYLTWSKKNLAEFRGVFSFKETMIYKTLSLFSFTLSSINLSKERVDCSFVLNDLILTEFSDSSFSHTIII